MNTKLTLAIDVNSILSTNPNVEGIIKLDAIEYISKLFQDGHYIIITSGLSSEENVSIKALLRKDKLYYHLFNANKPSTIEWFKEDPKKIVADCYIDADSLTYIPLHWGDIYKLIQEKWKQ